MNAALDHRLTLVVSDLRGGGTQRVIATVCEHLPDYFDVTVVTLDDPRNDFYTLDRRVKRVALGRYRNSVSRLDAVVANLDRVAALRRAISSSRPSVVISFVVHMNVLVLLATTGEAFVRIASERNDPARQSFGFPWDSLRRLLYRRADAITANSRRALTHLRSYVPCRKLVYLPNPTRIPERTEFSGSRHVILFVGRLVPHKRPMMLLDAFAALSGDYPSWKLIFVGDGPLRQPLEERVLALKLGQSLEFAGHVRDIDSYYKRSSIFVMPSEYEGTPNALLEAMAWGLACIASSGLGESGEFFEPGIDGLVFQESSVSDLRNCLASLMMSEEKRRSFGISASERARAHRPEKVVQEWVSIIRNTMAGRQR